MDPRIYEKLAEEEDRHWWFTTRRAITHALLKRLRLPAKASILEGGCGSGGNLKLLSQFGDLYAFEMNDTARERAQARGMGQVAAGSLPDRIPFLEKQFDLIAMFDVLEHIDDDGAALKALAVRLNAGGYLMLNVPAFQWLYSHHDKLHYHRRRYGRAELKNKVEQAGLNVQFISFWNFFMFPAAVAARLVERVRKPKGEMMGESMPPAWLNSLVGAVAGSERFILPHVPLPFGLSLMIIAKKP